MEKYETEFKLKVVESFLAGEGGAKLLARRWSVPEEKVRAWVSHYRLHGIAGLRPKRGSYTGHFKLQVLSHQDREQLSSRQVAAIYDIRNPNQVVVWRRALDEGGVAALESRRQARSMKAEKPNPEPADTDSPSSHRALPMEFIKTFGLFVVTALAEIVGCYLPYLWLKQGKSAWLLVPAAISLALFAWLLSLHPTAAGRVYAAYGGVYIGVAILWLWLVDKVTPTTTDWVGVGLCFLGMAVIMFGSTAEG